MTIFSLLTLDVDLHTYIPSVFKFVHGLGYFNVDYAIVLGDREELGTLVEYLQTQEMGANGLVKLDLNEMNVFGTRWDELSDKVGSLLFPEEEAP